MLYELRRDNLVWSATNHKRFRHNEIDPIATHIPVVIQKVVGISNRRGSRFRWSWCRNEFEISSTWAEWLRFISVDDDCSRDVDQFIIHVDKLKLISVDVPYSPDSSLCMHRGVQFADISWYQTLNREELCGLVTLSETDKGVFNLQTSANIRQLGAWLGLISESTTRTLSDHVYAIFL